MASDDTADRRHPKIKFPPFPSGMRMRTRSLLCIIGHRRSTASLFGYEVANALWAVTIPLAGLGGYSYVNGKIAEAQRGTTP